MSTPSNTGYNEADRQFHEKDEQALKAIRAKHDAERAAAQAAQQKAAHWMRCPKCGSQMKEVAFQGVMVDQCGTCGGVEGTSSQPVVSGIEFISVGWRCV